MTDARLPGRYIDELEVHECAAYVRRILRDAQVQERPPSHSAGRYLAGAILASLAGLAYDYLSDFSIGFTRPEERAFVGFLALFVALWGGLGLLAEAALRAANRRRAIELTALSLPHVYRAQDSP
jgi:hypothetical protein